MSLLTSFNAAKALVDKWKWACKEVGPAVKAFNDIRGASGEERSKAWEQLVKEADVKRVTDVSAMDIYDMHHNPSKHIALH